MIHPAKRARRLSLSALLGAAVLILLLGLVSARSGLASVPGATTNVCIPADSFSAVLIDRVDTVLLSSDTSTARLRTKLGITYSTTASKILLTTDERTCGKVRDGINAALKTPGLARQLYVIETGSGYAALEPAPAAPQGEYAAIAFLSKQFNFTGALNF